MATSPSLFVILLFSDSCQKEPANRHHSWQDKVSDSPYCLREVGGEMQRWPFRKTIRLYAFCWGYIWCNIVSFSLYKQEKNGCKKDCQGTSISSFSNGSSSPLLITMLQWFCARLSATVKCPYQPWITVSWLTACKDYLQCRRHFQM